jgi:hypothetical protein
MKKLKVPRLCPWVIRGGQTTRDRPQKPKEGEGEGNGRYKELEREAKRTKVAVGMNWSNFLSLCNILYFFITFHPIFRLENRLFFAIVSVLNPASIAFFYFLQFKKRKRKNQIERYLKRG